MNGGPEQEIISRHALADGIEIVLITSYPRTPSLRWTEICLPDEIIPESDYRPQNGHLIKEDEVELDIHCSQPGKEAIHGQT